MKKEISPDSPCPCGSGLPYSACHGPVEHKLALLRTRGERVPTRRLIKNAAQIEGIRRAGQANSLVLDAVEKAICPGMTTQEIDDIVTRETRALGGVPAPLNYEGFPKSVCTSVNEQICHGIPSDKVVLKEGDIVNVDCTTRLDGYYGDASRMFCLGPVSPEARRLVDVTAQSVELAISHLTPYCHLGDIGHYIYHLAKENGYSVVREIGGHGCGLAMHEDPYVCHVGILGQGLVLAPGMVLTIEPMLCQGSPAFVVDPKDGWQVSTRDKKLSAQVEHMILFTDTGVEVLSK